PNEIQSVTERINRILNARKTLERNWLKAQAQQARYYNKRHKPKKFDLDLWVFLSSKNIKFHSGKLAPKWLGPFKILQIVGTQAYKLDLHPLYLRIHTVFNVSLL